MSRLIIAFDTSSRSLWRESIEIEWGKPKRHGISSCLCFLTSSLCLPSFNCRSLASSPFLVCYISSCFLSSSACIFSDSFFFLTISANLTFSIASVSFADAVLFFISFFSHLSHISSSLLPFLFQLFYFSLLLPSYFFLWISLFFSLLSHSLTRLLKKKDRLL